MEDWGILNYKAMSKSKIKSWTSISIIIILAVIARIVPHVPNFAPIGGLALFSGANFKNKIALAIPLLVMFISDMFLGFHKTIPFVYGSFIIIALIGGLVKNYKWQSLIKASLVSSIIFFLVTNFGVWITGSMYQKNLDGLIQCYVLGLPFFRNTLISDLFYTFSFFYGYKVLSSLISNKLSLVRKD